MEKEKSNRGSLLVGELLPFFRAVAFSQAHIIQSNLPRVATPFFTSEDDLGRERTHQSSLLCPFPVPTRKIKANFPPNQIVTLAEGKPRT